MGATNLLAQQVIDEDGFPMQAWHPASNEWIDVLYTQVWDGAQWV